MEQSTLHEIEARCTQEAMPHCQARCPLHVDVRAFMEQMANNKPAEARKILERHLPLPEIMARICDHPCEDRCLRRDLGGSLAIGALERQCMETTTVQTKTFPRTPKEKIVAVLGAGLAGLVVAFELGKKAWPVTVFYEKNLLDTILHRFATLSTEAAQREIDALASQHCTFIQCELTNTLLAEVKEQFSGIFIDADAASTIFAGLSKLPDPLTGLLAENMVAGGMLEQSPTGCAYASSSTQAGQGKLAATTLERLLSGVSLTASRNDSSTFTTRLHTPLDGVSPVAAVLPCGEAFTPEEAASEASRCLRCQCMACVKQCVYLQKYGKFPRMYARQIYNNAAIVKGQHLANPLINGCMLCGQCTELCPERFSMAELCLSARQEMVERAYMSASAHEFALEDMDNANSSACSLVQGDPDGKPNTYALFPGCQLAASRGEQVLKLYDMLRASLPKDNGLAIILSCCGVPAHWAGQEARAHIAVQRIVTAWENLGQPSLLVACASCLKTFRELAPHMRVTSLWEFLASRLHGTAKPGTITLTMHDPCAARHDMAWQHATRKLATHYGVRIEEPPHTGLETPCCGYGGLVWCAQPEVADAAAAHRTQELSGKPALASCIMCRDRLHASCATCQHLLDIIPECATHDEISPPPGLSARRTNRATLQQQCMDRAGDNKSSHAFSGSTLESILAIEPALLADLERKHVLRQDVAEAVLAIEQSQRRFLERRSGHFVGSWRPRNVTFWVRYSRNVEGQLVLHDAWCHRMIVPHTGSPSKECEPCK